MKLFVSACLLGEACKYNGLDNLHPDVVALAKQYELVPFCPEVAGGLSTPRIPAEIVGDRVINQNGDDKTKEFELGAKKALSLCKKEGIRIAILKEKSPSCGVHHIYNGEFCGKLVDNCGITAKMLMSSGIRLYNEHEIEKLCVNGLPDNQK